MYVLGISAYYHDSAACLVKDGIIIAAAQEERFTRKKHDHSFPSNAIWILMMRKSMIKRSRKPATKLPQFTGSAILSTCRCLRQTDRLDEPIRRKTRPAT